MLSEDMKVLESNIQKDLQRFEYRQYAFRSHIDNLSEICDEMGIVMYSFIEQIDSKGSASIMGNNRTIL